MSLPFYAVPSYPNPQVVFATPYTSSIHPFDVHDMLRAEAARRQYVEEQRMLAQLRQREALRRQAEHRQRERLAALHRRRFAHLASPHMRRQIIVRPEYACVPEESKREDCFEDALAELLGLGEVEHVDAAMDAQRAAIQNVRKAAAVEQARKNAIAEQMKKVAAARKATEANRLRHTAIHDARLAKLDAIYDELQAALLAQDSIPADSVEMKASDSLDVHNQAARTIQRHWRSRSADKAAFKDAMNTIALLRDRLEFLKRTFNPPEHLEFRDLSDGEAAISALPYVSANVSVHAYINELTKLLILADGVPSAGNEKVREARRSFVKMAEKALDEVEAMVADMLERQKADSNVVSTPPVTATVQEPNLAAQAKPMETDVQAIVDMSSADLVEEQSGSEPAVVDAEAPIVDSITIRIDTPIAPPEPSVSGPEATVFAVGSDSSNGEVAEENAPETVPIETLAMDERHATPFGEASVPLPLPPHDVVEPQMTETSPESAHDIDPVPSTSANVSIPGLHPLESILPGEMETQPASDFFIVYPDSPSSQINIQALDSSTPKDDDVALEQKSASSTTSSGEEDFEVV